LILIGKKIKRLKYLGDFLIALELIILGEYYGSDELR
jgi:hypothetical protein